MKSKYYNVAGIRLRADSENSIGDSPLYAAFYAPEGDCDVYVRVTEGGLPAPQGERIAGSPGREFFSADGDVTAFSSYPEETGDRLFACRKGTGARIDLTIEAPDGLWDAVLFHALNMPELFAQRRIFLLHCSFIVSRGEAILFCAGKGVGKSTQAALWEKYRGAEIVNGDRALLQLSADGLTAFGTPYCGSSEIALNRSAPVRAVVLLEQGEDNALTRCGGASAFTRFMAQLSYEPYQTEKTVDFALNVCETVPLYAFRCLPEESAVSRLEEALWTQ